MDPIPATLQTAIQRRLRERGVHGLALSAFDATGTCFAGGVGYADLSRGEPVTPATVFRVASISKLFTTTLVLRLAQGGLVDLDAPVNSYVPAPQQLSDPQGRHADVPLRTLLSHSSGLPAGIRGIELGNPVVSRLANQGRVRDLEAAVTGLRVTHGVGEKVVYSNLGFNLAGFIAARTLGQRFEVAAREQVLGPLSMSDSEFTQVPRGRGVATNYGTMTPPGVGHRPIDGFRLIATPMGGLATSVADLTRFGQMILNGGSPGSRKLLSAEMVSRATAVEARNHPDLEQGFGLGFKVRSWRGRTVVGHDGNMPGVATQLVLSPEDGVGVVVLTNGFSPAVPHEVAELVLLHLLGLPDDGGPPDGAVPGDDGLRGDAASPLDSPDGGDFAAAELGRRAEGTYRLCDAATAGPVGRIDDLLTRIHVRHEVGGRLRVQGSVGTDGSAWLVPERRAGHYRLRAAVDDGTDSVLEECPDGTHIWTGYSTHLHSPCSRRTRRWRRTRAMR